MYKILNIIILFFFVSCSQALYGIDCFKVDNYKEDIDYKLKQKINTEIKNTINKFDIPGVVLVIGNNKKQLYKKAYGTIDGKRINTSKTIYDIASLSKLFTATAIIKLFDDKNYLVGDHVSDIFIKEFSNSNKVKIRFSDLLTHSSGFKAGTGSAVFDEDINKTWSNILNLRPSFKYGEFKYSDVNYLILGKALEKISKMTLDQYIDKKIFRPLGMKNSTYKAFNKDNCNELCAPTRKDKKLGHVHDPTSYKLGAVTGHAGIFSNADDISKYASLFLNEGTFCKKQILTKEQVKLMTTVDKKTGRGLGFDLLSPYSNRPRGDYFTKGLSFGHTGFTGTSLWIDPVKNIYLLVLSNTVNASDEKYAKRGFLDLNRKLSNLVGQFY